MCFAFRGRRRHHFSEKIANDSSNNEQDSSLPPLMEPTSDSSSIMDSSTDDDLLVVEEEVQPSTTAVSWSIDDAHDDLEPHYCSSLVRHLPVLATIDGAVTDVSENKICHDDNTKPAKKVSFGTVQMREYPMTLGCHPETVGGPSVRSCIALL